MSVVVVKKKLSGMSARALETMAARARKAAGVKGEVHILVTGDEELRRLNRRFRHKNRPTDVLSFPGDGNGLGGDIAISADMAAANARGLGHTLLHELNILIVHGMLHLAGYDHERDRGEMAHKEQELRRELGLPAGLIERTRRPGPRRGARQ
jgi:probable rRNA maturation factor